MIIYPTRYAAAIAIGMVPKSFNKIENQAKKAILLLPLFEWLMKEHGILLCVCWFFKAIEEPQTPSAHCWHILWNGLLCLFRESASIIRSKRLSFLCNFRKRGREHKIFSTAVAPGRRSTLYVYEFGGPPKNHLPWKKGRFWCMAIFQFLNRKVTRWWLFWLSFLSNIWMPAAFQKPNSSRVAFVFKITYVLPENA